MSYFKGIGRKSGSYGGRKLPLIGLLKGKKYTIFNEYIPGSGVGASSVVTRRLKKQRARIKKCSPPKPIYPKIYENNVFVVDDDITDFKSSELIGQINASDPEMTYDLRTDSNSNVDKEIFSAIAEKHLKALNKDTKSLTFTILSEYNASDFVSLLSHDDDDDYELIISEPIETISSGTEISQETTHQFIYDNSQGGKPKIEYIMTITNFTPLQ